MAKRKRLTPAQSGFLGADTPAPETKAAPLAPPIAQVAGEASARSALQELSSMVQDARAEGRLIRSLALDEVQADYMLRDRLLAPQDEDMQALIDSLRSRGQQTPIDVVELGEGRYGLVSGLRRLTAMRALRAEGGSTGFDQINARIISPQNGPDAYVSMVEENEIRAGLSYYERARIVVKSVEAGVFPDQRDALLTLYGNASRAKRSKIKSFAAVVEAFDGLLRFPAHMSERQGLDIARALAEDRGFAIRLRDALVGHRPARAEDEQERLRLALSPPAPDPDLPAPAQKAPAAPVTVPPVPVQNTPETDVKPDVSQTMQTDNMRNTKGYENSEIPSIGSEPAKGITLQVLDEGRVLVVKGPGVSDALRRDLEAWLATR